MAPPRLERVPAGPAVTPAPGVRPPAAPPDRPAAPGERRYAAARSGPACRPPAAHATPGRARRQLRHGRPGGEPRGGHHRQPAAGRHAGAGLHPAPLRPGGGRPGQRRALARPTSPAPPTRSSSGAGRWSTPRSSDPADDLGRFLVRRGVLTPEKLVQAEATRQTAGGDLVAALISARLVNLADVAGFLAERGAAMVGRALACEAGSFSWEPGVPPPPSSFPLGPPFVSLCAAVRALDIPSVERRLGERARCPAARAEVRVRLEELRLTPAGGAGGRPLRRDPEPGRAGRGPACRRRRGAAAGAPAGRPGPPRLRPAAGGCNSPGRRPRPRYRAPAMPAASAGRRAGRRARAQGRTGRRHAGPVAGCRTPPAAAPAQTPPPPSGPPRGPRRPPPRAPPTPRSRWPSRSPDGRRRAPRPGGQAAGGRPLPGAGREARRRAGHGQGRLLPAGPDLPPRRHADRLRRRRCGTSAPTVRPAERGLGGPGRRRQAGRVPGGAASRAARPTWT